MAAKAAIGAVTSTSSGRPGMDDLKQSACLTTREGPFSDVKYLSLSSEMMAGW